MRQGGKLCRSGRMVGQQARPRDLRHNDAMPSPPVHSRSRISPLHLLLATCLGLLLDGPSTAGGIDTDQMAAAVRGFVRDQTRGLPGDVVITIDPIDTTNQLSACTAFAPSLPPQARLWGRTAVVVRCLGPSSWEFYQPVRVQVFGQHLRSTRRLAAGQQVTAGDLSLARSDLTALPDSVLTDPSQAIGRRLRMGLTAGLPLLNEHLVIPPAVRQGQSVRVVASGQGFAVSSEGTALTNAAEGSQVVVRTASGQTVRGIARANGVVEVTF